MKMKRKRKNACPSSILDDSPKRTKVHAQRKFAQGSNVNSPVITPIRELESESQQTIVLPEPVELLPIKRPNTEDFLTFLCFRGTPILPPSLNFFNTASIVDTNGQVHEIKSESSHKNGPIDIAKCSTSSEKPFVAFGVRKRADPIVISRQMDRKRRHALALQALRRKYQEQKMAKIRALTISKLSEKITNKTLVKTNTISKTETITKKTNTNTLQKTKVVATTKHIKVTTRTLKTTMRPKMKMKQNMCLRSFRGRFIQQELPFRKRVIPSKPIRGPPEQKVQLRKKYDETDVAKKNKPPTSKPSKSTTRKIVKIITAPRKASARSTRSSLINTKSEIMRKQIKRILLPNAHTLIKPKARSLRTSTMKKSVMSRKQNCDLKIKSKPQETSEGNLKKKELKNEQKKVLRGDSQKTETRNMKETVSQTVESKETNKGKDITKDYKKVTDFKEVKTLDKNRRHLTRSLDNKKQINISTDFKRRPNIAVAKKTSKICNITHKKVNLSKSPKTEAKRSEKSSEGCKKSNSTEEINKRVTRQSDVSKNTNEVSNEKCKTREIRNSPGSAKKSKARSIGKDNSDESDSDLKDEKNTINTRKHRKSNPKFEEESSKITKEKNKKIVNKTVKSVKNSCDKEENLLGTDDEEKDDSIKKVTRSIQKSEEKELDKTVVEKSKKSINKIEAFVKSMNKESNIQQDINNLKKNRVGNELVNKDRREKSIAKPIMVHKGDTEKRAENTTCTSNKVKQSDQKVGPECSKTNINVKDGDTKGLKLYSTDKTCNKSEEDVDLKDASKDLETKAKVNYSASEKLKRSKGESGEHKLIHDSVEKIGVTEHKEKSIPLEIVSKKKSMVIHIVDDDEENTAHIKENEHKEDSKHSEDITKKKSTVIHIVDDDEDSREQKDEDVKIEDNENKETISKTKSTVIHIVDDEEEDVKEKDEGKKIKGSEQKEKSKCVETASKEKSMVIHIVDDEEEKLQEDTVEKSDNNEHTKTSNKKLTTINIVDDDVKNSEETIKDALEKENSKDAEPIDKDISPVLHNVCNEGYLEQADQVIKIKLDENKELNKSKELIGRRKSIELHNVHEDQVKMVETDSLQKIKDNQTSEEIKQIETTGKTKLAVPQKQHDKIDKIVKDSIQEIKDNEQKETRQQTEIIDKRILTGDDENSEKEKSLNPIVAQEHKDMSKHKEIIVNNKSTVLYNINIGIDTENNEVDKMKDKEQEVISKSKLTILPKAPDDEDDTEREVSVDKIINKYSKVKSKPLEIPSRRKSTVLLIVDNEENTKRKDAIDKIKDNSQKKEIVGRRKSTGLYNIHNEDKIEKEAADKDHKDKIKHTEILTNRKSTLLLRESEERSLGSQEEIKNEMSSTRSRREKRDDFKEENIPRSQRPSRKTKEAAAIYMELLSQKLVSDGGGDDDTISIDSFPELPNVKRTEQRENEMKAKAKTSKDDVKEVEQYDDNNKIIEEMLESTSYIDKSDKIKKLKKEDSGINKKISEPNPDKVAKENPGNPKVNKRKVINDNPVEIQENPVKSKLRKSDVSKSFEVEKNEEETITRRLRHSMPATLSNDQDSDESFHIHVKVPRKKKNIRRVSSRVTKVTKSLNISSSESDYSTTSDINIQPSTSQVKNKKFSKIKSTKKIDNNSSDSDDDEPLSKRTGRSVESSQKLLVKGEKVKDNTTTKETEKSTPKSKAVQKSPGTECVIIEPKRKRECAKLPQNYLPMFSSSDEDEIFHGFDEKVETKTKSFEAACSHAPPLLDLLNKDLGRRFGKEKVNMSNEQIEKWLKDSALAGSSIKKENDEMLKFGERIPTETTQEVSGSIDTEKLKESLLGLTKDETKDARAEPINTTPVKTGNIPKAEDSAKPQVDRKLIFRKGKAETNTPNINAFSPENESSVYAFGEENEETISTPFRRPSRRPSSTATSKSEDESSKHDESSRSGHFRKPSLKVDTPKDVPKDDSEPASNPELEDSKQFYIPQKPTKTTLLKAYNKSLFKSKSSEKLPDIDEFKYKVPSSPSASSSSSAKLYKRQTQKQKTRSNDLMTPIYVSDFPKNNESARLVEAPVFHPTEQEFQDPLEYIERIRHKAEQFGICRIVPPTNFKPECKVTDDMRFTAYNQYVNKMLYRWGPNFKEFMAIKKYLETQSISLSHPPWIGGMEIDLPRLYQTVQTLGGLKEVIEKKKWSKVSELMKIPKSAQDRVTKLDDIYCKYLLPYDTLSPAEREKLFDDVETEWAKKESRNLVKNQEEKLYPHLLKEEEFDDDTDECITKGRNMALNAFYRIARNTMSMYFKTTDPLPQEVEQEYWKYVVTRENHICVNSGSIDCGNWGYGFAVTKNSPFAKHPWNLKMLTNNSGSVLRSLGPLMGVTVPTLHVGMVFSASCWYRDPHGLPWIEYLHTGGTKIWYGVPNSMADQFHSSLKTLVPNYCKNKDLWLPSDSIMVPPNLLVENNVSLCHAIQEPGQFIVVFPKAFTSSICTGYTVSESVFFAPIYWLKTARALFDSLSQSNEPTMFSLDRLLISVINDGKCNVEIIRQTMPHIQELCAKELDRREKLEKLGEVMKERLPIPEVSKGKKKKFQQGEGDYECEMCRCSLFLSLVFDTVEGITYCLDHALAAAEKNELILANCKFMFTYDDEEIKQLPEKVKNSLDTRFQKKIPNKFAGMPTLLGKLN